MPTVCLLVCFAGMPLSSDLKAELRAAVVGNRMDDFYAKWGNHVVFGFTRGASAAKSDHSCAASNRLLCSCLQHDVALVE